MADEYILYILTGAIFGALIAVVYQMRYLMKMDKKLIGMDKKLLEMEKKILSKISRKKK